MAGDNPLVRFYHILRNYSIVKHEDLLSLSLSLSIYIYSALFRNLIVYHGQKHTIPIVQPNKEIV